MVRVLRVKPMIVITRNYAQKSLMAFLEGKKNLNWIVGVIRSSGVRGGELKEIFNLLAGFGNKLRFQQAMKACKDKGFLE